MDRTALLAVCQRLAQQLQTVGVRIHLDLTTHHSTGWKLTEYEVKGVPLRLVVGEKELANQTVELTRRDTSTKLQLHFEELTASIPELLRAIQKQCYEKALRFREMHTTPVTNWAAFKEALQTNKGFVLAPWDGTTATELKIKEETQATIRCQPFTAVNTTAHCVYTGKPAQAHVLFAHAY